MKLLLSRGLIRLGHQAKHRISLDLTDLDNFEVEEIFYEFQMLSLLAFFCNLLL